MDSFHLTILKADAMFYEGPGSEVVVPALDGLYGVLPGHSNTILALIPGKLTFKVPGRSETVAAVSSGFIKVENGDVLILVDAAERPEEIDINRAKRAADEALEAMLQQMSRQDYHTAQSRLARALNRMSIKEHYDTKT